MSVAVTVKNMQVSYTAAEMCGLGLLLARQPNGYGCRISGD